MILILPGGDAVRADLVQRIYISNGLLRVDWNNRPEGRSSTITIEPRSVGNLEEVASLRHIAIECWRVALANCGPTWGLP